MPLPDSRNRHFNFQPSQTGFFPFLLFLFALASAATAHSQVYTVPEGIALAGKLRQLKILSPKGEKVLLARIRHTQTGYDYAGGESEDDIESGLTREGPNGPGYREVSNTTLLLFLQEAFSREFWYRTGPVEVMYTPFGNAATPNNRERRQTAAEKAALAEGPKTEAAIPTEDALSEKGFVTYGLPAGKQESGWIDPSRSATGRTRSRTLLDLQKAGLVEAEVAAELLPRIKDNTLAREGDLLAQAAIQTAFRADYEAGKTGELKVAKELVATGVMSNAGYEELLASYQPYKLKGKFGLLPFCERTVMFQPATMPEAPQPFFEEVFRTLQAQLLPAFKYQNLKATIGEIPPGFQPSETNSVARKLEIRFSVADLKFSDTVFYDYAGGYPIRGTKHPVGPGLVKGINQWLGRQALTYKLYFANQPDRNGIFGKEQFALLLLTPAQFEAWHSSYNDYFLFE